MSTTTVTENVAITAENVATLFPDVDTSLARSILPSSNDPSVRQGGDLDGYDEEQVRLMEEVCIVLDYDDKPIGSASKKTCMLPLSQRSYRASLESKKNNMLIYSD
jgi:isopentenyl-diphosphate Delta-isomerase